MDTADIFNLSEIHPNTQKHLSKVYALLASGILTSIITFILNQYIHIPHYIFYALGIVSLIADIILIFTSKEKPFTKKMNILSFYGYAISLGGSLSVIPFELSKTQKIYFYQISFEALLMTILIFFSFSAFALLTSKRFLIYLGVSITVSIFSFINFFIWNGKAEIIIGMIMALGYIIIDTQQIIHRAEKKYYNSPLMDAKLLFIDFAELFIKLLIYLLQKKAKEEKDEDKDK